MVLDYYLTFLSINGQDKSLTRNPIYSRPRFLVYNFVVQRKTLGGFLNEINYLLNTEFSGVQRVTVIRRTSSCEFILYLFIIDK